MTNDLIDEAPSQFRLIATLLLVVLLAAFATPLLEMLRNALPEHMRSGWGASTDLVVNGIFGVVVLALCLITPRASGLGIGDGRKWKRFAYGIAFVWIMPPLLVLSLYPALTDRPFHAFHWPIGWWCARAIAQELLFTGFVYGRLTSIFGTPREGAAGVFSAPLLITAFLAALFHWPNLQTTEHGMSTSFVQFQFLYTFLGFAWMLNIRRWTNCIWLNVLNHVIVNFLATIW